MDAERIAVIEFYHNSTSTEKISFFFQSKSSETLKCTALRSTTIAFKLAQTGKTREKQEKNEEKTAVGAHWNLVGIWLEFD